MKKMTSLLFLVAFTLCLSTNGLAGEPPCDDAVRAKASGNTIVVYHDQAEWNCCAEIEFELTAAQDTFNLYEFETFGEGGPCVCICCFDLTTMITDVAPGDYLVRVLDGLSGGLFGEVWVTVEPGVSGVTALGGTSQSPCGGWTTAVEDPPIAETNWGRVKALFR